MDRTHSISRSRERVPDEDKGIRIFDTFEEAKVFGARHLNKKFSLAGRGKDKDGNYISRKEIYESLGRNYTVEEMVSRFRGLKKDEPDARVEPTADHKWVVIWHRKFFPGVE